MINYFLSASPVYNHSDNNIISYHHIIQVLLRLHSTHHCFTTHTEDQASLPTASHTLIVTSCLILTTSRILTVEALACADFFAGNLYQSSSEQVFFRSFIFEQFCFIRYIFNTFVQLRILWMTSFSCNVHRVKVCELYLLHVLESHLC